MTALISKREQDQARRVAKQLPGERLARFRVRGDPSGVMDVDVDGVPVYTDSVEIQRTHKDNGVLVLRIPLHMVHVELLHEAPRAFLAPKAKPEASPAAAAPVEAVTGDEDLVKARQAALAASMQT